MQLKADSLFPACRLFITLLVPHRPALVIRGMDAPGYEEISMIEVIGLEQR